MDEAIEPTRLFELARSAPTGAMAPVPAALSGTPAGSLLDTLGVHLTHIGAGQARAEMLVAAVHLNQRGHLQGGALAAFADAAAGWASDGALPTGNFTTIEMTCHLLRRVEPGTALVATASTVHLGRRSLVQGVEVFKAAEEHADLRRLVARFTCTQLVLG